MKVSEAREVLTDSEAMKLIDQDEVIRLAKERTENNGIVFLDEIDFLAFVKRIGRLLSELRFIIFFKILIKCK